MIKVPAQSIKHLSVIQGGGGRIRVFARERGFEVAMHKGLLQVSGDWDLWGVHISALNEQYDYELFKKGMPHLYEWEGLYESLKEGYKDVDNSMKVAVGRGGQLLLIDGRHRLIIARDLNIDVKAKVVYVHPLWDRKNIVCNIVTSPHGTGLKLVPEGVE